MMYPEIPVLSFISAGLSLVPLIWYLQARNIAALAVGIWLLVVNLTYAVDALIWADDNITKASAWCDVSTNLITGSRIALPAACFAICIQLGRLASFRQTPTPQVKRRRIIFEWLMCFGVPLAYIMLHLIVQPHRFDLYYGFGCRPASYPTIATVILVMAPPLLLTLATITCAGIACHHFLVRDVQFYGKRGSISSPARHLYFRLVSMALLVAILSAVLVAVVMWGVLSPGLALIGSMSRDLNEIVVWDSEAITGTIRTVLRVEWSLTVVQSIAFFGLFAFPVEVVRKGLELVHSFQQQLGLEPPVILRDNLGSSSSSITAPTLPLTEVDLSLGFQSSGTLAPYGASLDKFPSIHNSPRSSAKDTLVEVVPSPSTIPLEPSSRNSAIGSSHDSYQPNFDPSHSWLVLSPDVPPQAPTSTPAYLCCRSFDAGYGPEQLYRSRLDVHEPFPPAKIASHIRSRTAGAFGKLRRCEPEKRYAVHMTTVRETK